MQYRERYGLKRVGEVLRIPRSPLYARRNGGSAERDRAEVGPRGPRRCGPEPKSRDSVLLEAIVKELCVSPFVAEGHRPVRARLRQLRNVRV